MLFNFILDPIDEIAPWGEPPDLSLSWYGLTHGEYFLQAGSEQLLRYSDAARQAFVQQCPLARNATYVNYQVGRFHEDVFQIIPRILEPIPSELITHATSDREQSWPDECLCRLSSSSHRTEAGRDLFNDAATWLRQRSLDTQYLITDANIWFWRLEDTIHIEWDNRTRMFEGVPMWSAVRGSYSLAVEEFMAELNSFHRRFIEAMGRRIEDVCRSFSRPEIHIDLDKLRAAQSFWDDRMERFILRWEPTDWPAVIAAVQHIESRATS